VLIAACDTFRSGAVEQLKVHARCLEVDVYDKGYHKDPAAVAREAIKDATAVRISWIGMSCVYTSSRSSLLKIDWNPESKHQ
jgi:signal recognition particle GTPase